MNKHVPSTSLPLLELDLLKTLVAIHETGNFSKAAESVLRTPSAVSMQVKRLEELLDRPVFVRDSRTVTLTADGEMLLNHARRMLKLNQDVMVKFKTPEVFGEVRLGAVVNTAEQFLPKVLKRFGESHPGVTVDVVVENSVELKERMKNRQLDLALITVHDTHYLGLPVEILYSDKLVWAGLKCGIAGEQSPLPISVWEEGCIWRQSALEGLQEAGIDYRIALKSAHVAGQRAAIMGDLAIAPIPVSMCDGEIINVEEVFGLPPLLDYHIGFVAQDNPPAQVTVLINYLRDSFSSMKP